MSKVNSDKVPSTVSETSKSHKFPSQNRSENPPKSHSISKSPRAKAKKQNNWLLIGDQTRNESNKEKQLFHRCLHELKLFTLSRRILEGILEKSRRPEANKMKTHKKVFLTLPTIFLWWAAKSFEIQIKLRYYNCLHKLFLGNFENSFSRKDFFVR